MRDSIEKRNLQLKESAAKNQPQKSITSYTQKAKIDIKEMVARLVCEEDLPIAKLLTPTYQNILKSMYQNVPKSRETFKSFVNDFAKKLKVDFQLLISDLIEKNEKFSLSFDEWKSLKRRSYLGKIYK